MNYTIASMKDFNGNQEIGIDKYGNQYTVWHRNKAWSTSTRKTFDSLEEAESLFLTLAKCFIRGEWSTEDRVKIMLAWSGSQHIEEESA